MSIKELLRHRYLAFAFRLLLGVTFLVAGAGKLPKQMEFVDLVASLSLGPIPAPLSHAYALALPWAELALGLMLILGLFARFAAGATILLVLSFIFANSLSIVYGTGDDCGCFGDLVQLQSGEALLIDIAMLAMATQVLLHRGKFLSLVSRL